MWNRTRFLRSALVAAVAAAACTTASTPGPIANQPVRVMSFNIRYGTAPDGANAWALRRHLTLRVIRDFAPDVLGVQEALRFQLDEIRRELPHLGEVGVGRDDGLERGEYSAILFDRRRLEPIEHGTFWLSDTPAAPGSRTWGNNFPRIVTWARFRDLAGHSTFYAFNTHWDHESQPSRERSASLLLERIRTRTAADPVILTGDFNAGEDNAAFRALLVSTSAGLLATTPGATTLADTYRAIHPNAANVGTFHAFRGDRAGAKIDAILASPDWQVAGADIVLLSENGVYPSDHYPVTATLVRGGR